MLQGVLADRNHFAEVQLSIIIREFHLKHLDVLHNATHSEIVLAVDLHRNKTWHGWHILAQFNSSKSEWPPQLPTQLQDLSADVNADSLLVRSDLRRWYRAANRFIKRWDDKAREWRHKPVSASEKPKLSHFPPVPRESPYHLQDPEQTVYNLQNTMLILQMRFNSCSGPVKSHNVHL